MVQKANLRPGVEMVSWRPEVSIACQIRDDRDGEPFHVEVRVPHEAFASAGRFGWPAGEGARARVLARLAIGDALDAGADLRSSSLILEPSAIERNCAPRATSAEIREYVMLKAAWSDRLGEAGCQFSIDDARRLGGRIGLIHNAVGLLIDEEFVREDGSKIRPTFTLVHQFESGQVGHAPPLLARIIDRLGAPRYAAVHEQVAKALDAFRAGEQDLAEAANSAVRAVEALAKIITNEPTKTLGDAVKTLRTSGAIRPPLDKAFEAIYGFRNSRPGLGHGGVVPSDTELREAAFVFNQAAACLTYLLDLDRPGR